MGAQIAALAAGAGLPVLLLDLTREAAVEGLARAKRLKPDPAFSADVWSRITPGSFTSDLAAAGRCDWIIEAIIEDAAAKRALLAGVDAARRPETLVTTNTSALAVAGLAEGRSDSFRQHWAGTHFFNPPRYLPLVELVPGPETSPAVMERLAGALDLQLGKSVVVTRDTPGFIGNHLALFATSRILAEVEAGHVSIEEADALTGPLLGRPKSATFRTLDLAGLDIVAHVMGDLATRLPDAHARHALAPPDFLTRMVGAGARGEKAGRGFYQRVRQPDGRSRVDVVDLASLTYRAAASARSLGLDGIQALPDAADRLRALFADTGRAGAFTRATLAPTLVYAARVAGAIS